MLLILRVFVVQADRPHGSNRITSVAFFTRPDGTTALATTGSEGTVKIWTRSVADFITVTVCSIS